MQKKLFSFSGAVDKTFGDIEYHAFMKGEGVGTIMVKINLLHKSEMVIAGSA